MNLNVWITVLRWSADIFGGLITLFFLIMLMGNIGQSFAENSWKPLNPMELLMFFFLGVSIAGLILAYFKRLLGARLTMVGLLLFILTETFLKGKLFVDNFFFNMVFIAGTMHFGVYYAMKGSEEPKITG